MSRIHQALSKITRETRKENPQPSLMRDLERSLSVLVQEHPNTVESVHHLASAPDPASQKIHVPSEVRELPVSSNPKLVSVLARRSIPSEQYRALKTRLFQLRNNNRIRTILITSAAPSEGKTLTAVNLGLTIAQEIDQKVLLVDCDLRKPSVHTVLGLSRDKGLADLLEGNLQRENAILTTSVPNFYVAPAGTIPENPAELLNTQAMRDFLASAAEQFDWVILDAPPLVPLADAELMSTLVDGVLLVVRAHHAPAELVSKSVQALKGKKVLGIVFNGSDKPKRTSTSTTIRMAPKTLRQAEDVQSGSNWPRAGALDTPKTPGVEARSDQQGDFDRSRTRGKREQNSRCSGSRQTALIREDHPLHL